MKSVLLTYLLQSEPSNTCVGLIQVVLPLF